MFIVKKKIGNKEYYYLRKSERKDGKVRAITVAYLGKDKKQAEMKAKEIISKITRVTKERDSKEKIQKIEKAKKKEKIPIKAEVESKEEKEFISFIQEAGLIWGPEPEIYGGFAGFYTYGPLGKLLKNKVENLVRKVFNSNGFREMEGPVILPDVVWKASGHLDTFTDPVIFTKDGKESYRVDKLLEEKGITVSSLDSDYLLGLVRKHKIKAPDGKDLNLKIELQSLMMKTKVAGQDASLRPETATVTYLPFPRILNYFRKKLPFAVYQIGKAYRNEISPRQHVLRGREFTQAEGQIFIDPLQKDNWEKYEEIKKEKLPFWDWKFQAKGGEITEVQQYMKIEDALKKGFVKSKAYAWCLHLAYKQFLNFGIPKERIRLRQHSPGEMAHYADDAWDVEVRLNNYGWVEVCGVHDRTDYDLKQHSKESGVELEAIREDGSKFVPHILEIAFGTDRPTYALLDIFYEKKEVGDGKTMFRIPYHMAPIDVSIFPLMKKPELVKVALEIKQNLEKDFVVDYDLSGSVGKRYLRSATAGTPFAVTIDYDSLEKKDVTIRDRDSEKQVRVKIDELREVLKKLIDREKKLEDVGKVVEKRGK